MIHRIRTSTNFADKELYRRKSIAGQNRKPKKLSRRVKSAFIYAGVVVYIILGATFFFVIEKTGATIKEADLDPRLVNHSDSCIGNQPFWGAVFYAFSTASTIGYGQINVCCSVNRVVTVFYSLIGIPFMVYALADLGQNLCFLLSRWYKRFSLNIWWCMKANRMNVVQFLQRFIKPVKVKSPVESSESSASAVWPNLQLNSDLSSLRYIDGSDITTVVNLEPVSSPDSAPIVKLNSVPTIIANSNPHTVVNINSDEDFNRDNFEIKYANEDVVTSSTKNAFNRLSMRKRPSIVEVLDFENPDLPLWICVVLLLILILLITLYIHTVEKVPYAAAVYYAMLFFIMQAYEIRDLRTTIPTFILLLAGLAIISTTISAIIYNIQNMIFKAHRLLPEEIRRRKLALAAAGYPDAIVDPNEVLQDLLKSQGSYLSRAFLPDTKLEGLEQYGEHIVEEVENEIEKDYQFYHKHQESQQSQEQNSNNFPQNDIITENSPISPKKRKISFYEPIEEVCSDSSTLATIPDIVLDETTSANFGQFRDFPKIEQKCQNVQTSLCGNKSVAATTEGAVGLLTPEQWEKYTKFNNRRTSSTILTFDSPQPKRYDNRKRTKTISTLVIPADFGFKVKSRKIQTEFDEPFLKPNHQSVGVQFPAPAKLKPEELSNRQKELELKTFENFSRTAKQTSPNFEKLEELAKLRGSKIAKEVIETWKNREDKELGRSDSKRGSENFNISSLPVFSIDDLRDIFRSNS